MHYGMGMGQKPTTLVPQFPVLSVLLVKTQVFNNHLHIMSIFVHLPIPQAHSSSISLANLFARFMKSSASTCGVGRHGPADPSIRNSMFLTSWEARHTLRWSVPLSKVSCTIKTPNIGSTSRTECYHPLKIAHLAPQAASRAVSCVFFFSSYLFFPNA